MKFNYNEIPELRHIDCKYIQKDEIFFLGLQPNGAKLAKHIGDGHFEVWFQDGEYIPKGNEVIHYDDVLLVMFNKRTKAIIDKIGKDKFDEAIEFIKSQNQ